MARHRESGIDLAAGNGPPRVGHREGAPSRAARHVRGARRRLPAPIFLYNDGGADDERTLARNSDAFADYELLPDVLTHVSHIRTTTRLFGRDGGDGVQSWRPPARRRPRPVDQIAPVADAVGGRVEIICDGGVRRGSDVVKALALGATACFSTASRRAGRRGWPARSPSCARSSCARWSSPGSTMSRGSSRHVRRLGDQRKAAR